MKYLIASDIHGSYYYGKLIVDKFNEHHCDQMILLGDILYHGPRNDLPKEYNPKLLFPLLKQYKDVLTVVRGNCDAEIDGMVLEKELVFPYFKLTINNKDIYFTHGDHYNSDNLPAKDIILVHGHTHVIRCEQHQDHVYINPGSISIPKENDTHSYIVLENNVFTFYDENDNVLNTYIF